MPYDPAKPANNSALSSAEMRGQLTSLKALIDAKVTQGDIDTAIGGTSSNSNGVADLSGMVISDPPTQGEVQTILDKLNELIGALRR